MADIIEQGSGDQAGNAALAPAPNDQIEAAAATPSDVAPVASPQAEPAAKPAPAKKGAGRVKKTPAPVATIVEPVVASVAEPTVKAKAATPKRTVRKARAATTPVAPVAPAPTTTAKQPAKQPANTAAAAPTRAATAPRKEPRTMTTPATEITEKFQAAIKDASEKTKAAFEKSQASFGELGAFTKGNVEALVEASKIFAAGLQELSKGYLSESKSAFETLTAEMKDLAAVKSPSELLEKQSTLLRKQFDAAVAASSKNSEAVLKLVNEAFQPISTRVSLAVEKVKKAA